MFTYSALLKYSGVPHLTTKNSLGRPFRRTTNPMAHSSYLFFFLVLFGIPFVIFALTFLPDSSRNSDPGSHISRPFYPLPTAVISRLFSPPSPLRWWAGSSPPSSLRLLAGSCPPSPLRFVPLKLLFHEETPASFFSRRPAPNCCV